MSTLLLEYLLSMLFCMEIFTVNILSVSGNRNDLFTKSNIFDLFLLAHGLVNCSYFLKRWNASSWTKMDLDMAIRKPFWTISQITWKNDVFELIYQAWIFWSKLSTYFSKWSSNWIIIMVLHRTWIHSVVLHKNIYSTSHCVQSIVEPPDMTKTMHFVRNDWFNQKWM